MQSLSLSRSGIGTCWEGKNQSSAPTDEKITSAEVFSQQQLHAKCNGLSQDCGDRLFLLVEQSCPMHANQMDQIPGIIYEADFYPDLDYS